MNQPQREESDAGRSSGPPNKIPFVLGEMFPAWAWVVIIGMIIILYWKEMLSADVFFSVLLASALGHASAAAISRRNEHYQRQIEHRQEIRERESVELVSQNARSRELAIVAQERKQSLAVVLAELKANRELVLRLREYPQKLAYLHGDAMVNQRARDPYLERFSDAWYEMNRKDVGIGVGDSQLLVGIDALYHDFRYCNALLRHVEEFVYRHSRPEVREEVERYKQAVTALNWWPTGALFEKSLNTLDSGCAAVIGKLDQLLVEKK